MMNAHVYGATGLVLALGALVLLPAAAASSQSAPLMITTDTPEYCLHLFDEVSELIRIAPSPPPEIASLTSEGQRMCGQGKTRGGIMRLRRALVMLRAQTSAR